MVRYQYAQRYQSAKEALQALSAFVVSSEPQTKKILMGTANPSAKVIKSQRRSAETASGLLIGGVIILGAATILYVTSVLNKPNQPAIVVNTLPKLEPNTTVPTPPVPIPDPEPTPAPPLNYGERLPLEIGMQTVKDGVLKPNQVLTYLFEGEEGQKLFTNISGTGILITVLAPNGEPLDARAARVSGWNGTLAYTGSYQIQLKSTATGNEPQSATGAETKFVLSVLLNQDFPRVIDVPPQ